MRYKEFNKNAVLEKCIPLFWANGFGACPISEIVKITNVNRFSLYAEFENKEGILHQAMDLYIERYASQKIEILRSPGSIKTVLERFYQDYLTETAKHPRGCFIIHIATEMADHDPKVKAILDVYLAEIEELILHKVKQEPELSEQSHFYARQLVGLFCTSMSFCLIHSEAERKEHIERGLRVILKNTKDHGAYAEQ